MLFLSELDRMCTATLAGAFGVRNFQPDNFNEIEFRQLRAGVANTSRQAVAKANRRAGPEQGNL